ncbi:hypothetical protein Tco_0859376, partial [Tanacetum coccineum]
MLDWRLLCHRRKRHFKFIIDVIKNSTCYKAFTISAKVLEIFMQQFWYTVKKGVDFAELPDDEATFTFLLTSWFQKVSNYYNTPMHVSGTTSHLTPGELWLLSLTSVCPENADYPELIWEDFAFQIDYKQLKKGRLLTHIIKDDGFVSRLKFVRIGEYYKEYGLLIPETMLTDGIKQSESFQMFIKYSTKSDPEPAKKRTASRRVVKKKVTITADDNIVPEPDVALELGKSISLTEAAEEEAARKVHDTHARIMTEMVLEPTSRRPSGIAFRDTSTVLKNKSSNQSQKLKGTGGSSEGSGVSLGVLDESIVIPATSSEGTSTKTRVPDEEKANSEADKKDNNDYKSINLEQTDDEETDDEFVHGEEHVQDNDEETDDEFVHGDEQVNENEDGEMTNVEVEESGNGDEEVTDAAKVDAGKTEEVKDDAKKAELPPTSSSLSVSSSFGDQFLKLLSDTSLIGTAKDTTDTEINS